MNQKTRVVNNEKPYHEAGTVDELISRNVSTIRELEKSAQHAQTATDRIADAITRFCGSMAFLWVHVIWFAAWIAGNTFLLKKPVDPFPFNFLTLVVSLEAIFLSTFILISENRQSKVDERRSHLDLQINLLAEQENTKMLQMLKAISEKLGVSQDKDPTVAVLEKAIRPEIIVEQIDQTGQSAE